MVHIDTSDKIKVFDSFEGLSTEIVNDMESNDMLAQRYAVRFIMLNNFDELKKLAKLMAKFGVDFLDLEELIEEDDEWITKDMLRNALMACKTSTFVTPFSEVVRFYNDDDFRGFFNDIMLMEDVRNPRKRIYVPLIGLQNRFTDFLNHFARIGESAPVWRYDAEKQTVEVYFTKYKNYEIPQNEIQCKLTSLRDWLKFWKVQAPQERIVCTSLPISAKFKYSKPDNIFNFVKIDSAYEFMTKFMDLSFPFVYEEKDKIYWEELLRSLEHSKGSSFSYTSYVHDVFNKKILNVSEILEEWVKEDTTSFHRWLLYHYVQHTKIGECDSYLKLCMEAVTDLNDARQLPNYVATLILYEMPANKKAEYAQERRKLIKENADFYRAFVTEQEQQWLLERTKEIFLDSNNLSNALELCTGVFDYEHILLMGWYAHNQQNKAVKEAVKTVYPELAAYLKDTKPSSFAVDNQWCIEYLHGYRKAKLQDAYIQEIATFIKDKNATSKTFYQWYYSFEESHDVLADVSHNSVLCPDKVYWIDGLGAEFLPYLLYLIEEKGSSLKVVQSQITRTTIPSSTSLNRFEGINVVKYGALDELGHDAHGYKYLYTLNEELMVLKNIINEIIDTCQKQKCTIAIVSDHGLSCLSRKVPSKKYDGKFEHEGRYIKTSSEAETDHDYLVHKNEKDGHFYKVALTHSSLAKVPTHEVHGGCTPEEVLVPFVLLSNKDVASNIVYQVKLIDSEIMLSNPVVRLSIIPEPIGVSLICNGRAYEMKREGTNWLVKLEGISEGIHILDVKPKEAASIQLEVKVIGIGNNSDINEMFTL
mgnify:FL=1